VGKTWVAAALARALRERGSTVAARKPAQSFVPGEGPTDAEVLAAATGEDAQHVCPPHRWYEVPMAPPMAAAVLGRGSFTVADLAAELRFPSPVDYGLVEGAGGVRSPMADDGDVVDLAAALEPDAVVLVADAGLGTINAVRLSVGALGGWPVVTMLNRFDEDLALHRENLRWLHERAGVRVVCSIPDLADSLD
jgi:dethiobiotin synthetase